MAKIQQKTLRRNAILEIVWWCFCFRCCFLPWLPIAECFSSKQQLRIVSPIRPSSRHQTQNNLPALPTSPFSHPRPFPSIFSTTVKHFSSCWQHRRWLTRSLRYQREDDAVNDRSKRYNENNFASISNSTSSSSRRDQTNTVLVDVSFEENGSTEAPNATTTMATTNPKENSPRLVDPYSSTSSSNTTSNQNPSTLPSYRQLLVFTATTILIWISEPLLSLVDTTIVGLTASSSRSAVVQIAALGPATTFYDSAVYMTYFLAMATTNLIAPALAQRKYRELRHATSYLMGLAALFGSLVAAFAFGLGKPLITQMVVGAASMGSSSAAANAAMIPLATQYAWIRASVAPFCVVDFVAQSFCLATLDTKTPVIAVTVASVVNILGDLLLSPKWGIQGAAVATAMATVSSCYILVHKVRRQTTEWKRLQREQEQSEAMGSEVMLPSSSSSFKTIKTQVVNGTIELVDAPDLVDCMDKDANQQLSMPICTASPYIPLSSTNRQGRFSSLFFQNNNNKYEKKAIDDDNDDSDDIPFWSLPNKQSLLDLCQLAGPIFFVMMGKIACYSVVTVRATNYGMVPLAAHNIMMRVFFFFACFGDSLSQAAQTFFPQVAREDQENNQERPLALRNQLFRRLFYLSAFMGLGISQVATKILSHWGQFLTKEEAILQTLTQYAPLVGGAVMMHPLIMLLEGTILARRDLLHLVGIYTSTMMIHFGMVFVSPLSTTFDGLWKVFLGFQSLRFIQCAARVLFLTHKERDAQRKRKMDAPI